MVSNEKKRCQNGSKEKESSKKVWKQKEKEEIMI